MSETKTFDRQVEALKAVENMLSFCKRQKENGGCENCLLEPFLISCNHTFQDADDVIRTAIETDNIKNISFNTRQDIVQNERHKAMMKNELCRKCKSNIYGRCNTFACSVMASIDEMLCKKYKKILKNKNLSKGLRYKATVIYIETKYMDKELESNDKNT